MRVLIIEDEKPAAKRLERLLLSYDKKLEVIARLDSVKGAVKWFSDHSQPDLIFMDIQLADGLSFEIFEHEQITAPIIFTTAYDEYALKAFKVNSIDYLLKPIDENDLASAFDKLKLLKADGTNESLAFNSLDQISQAVNMLTRQHKNRFIIKIGDHIKAISVNDILFFLVEIRPLIVPQKMVKTICWITPFRN